MPIRELLPQLLLLQGVPLGQAQQLLPVGALQVPGGGPGPLLGGGGIPGPGLGPPQLVQQAGLVVGAGPLLPALLQLGDLGPQAIQPLLQGLRLPLVLQLQGRLLLLAGRPAVVQPLLIVADLEPDGEKRGLPGRPEAAWGQRVLPSVRGDALVFSFCPKVT